MSKKNSEKTPDSKPERLRFGPALWPDTNPQEKKPDPDRQRFGLELEQEEKAGPKDKESNQ